jgi:hypothetical protein
MNVAEEKRDKRIARMFDLDLLNVLLADTTGDIKPTERAMFEDMKRWVADGLGEPITGRCLSTKQRSVAEDAAKRIVPIDVRDVPKGKEVPTPSVLKNLPKSPPKRRSE